MFLSTPGFHAIAFVIRSGRLTDEYMTLVKILLSFFGEDVKKFAFVIFTFIENYNDLFYYMTKQRRNDVTKSNFKSRIQSYTLPKQLQEIFDLCQGKIMIIDNKANKDILDGQVQDIFEEIEKIQKSTGHDYYQNAHLKATEEMIKKYDLLRRKGTDFREFLAGILHRVRLGDEEVFPEGIEPSETLNSDEERHINKGFQTAEGNMQLAKHGLSERDTQDSQQGLEESITDIGTSCHKVQIDTNYQFKKSVQNDESFLDMMIRAVKYVGDKIISFGRTVKNKLTKRQNMQ